MEITRFVNTPVPSNTYVLQEAGSLECVVIDPGTKGSEEVVDYIRSNGLHLKYILLTHGDFDHVWGVVGLKEAFSDAQIVASRDTARSTAIPQNYFSALYFGTLESYRIERIDYIIDEQGDELNWRGSSFRFIQVPGHTTDSNIILVNDTMFSGDTILKDTKPFIQKRHGGNKEDFKKSVRMILDSFTDDMLIYPGHGDNFRLGDVRAFYENYFRQ